MGLIHKTKFIPFVDISKTESESYKRIKKSTTFSLAFNPQTKTFDFISSDNPEEEIDSYQPALNQSLTMFDDEPDFNVFFNMAYHLPTGGDAHRNALIVFYALKDAVNTYALTSDEEIVEGKTYYTRSGSEGSYTYTAVTTPVLADIGTYYEVTATTNYYKAWKTNSVVKMGTLDSVNQSLDFDLALNDHDEGAVTIVTDASGEKIPTWVPGTWSGDDWVEEHFTPAA